MANPFASLGAVPIMQTIQDTLQRQANLQATQVGTAMESAKLNLLNQQMQRDQEYRDAVMRGQVLNPTINNPQTTSLATSDQGTPGPMGGIVDSLMTERRDTMENIRLARLYNQDAKPFLTHLSNIDTNLREATRDFTKDRSEKMEQTANTLRDVNSPAALREALNNVASNVGQAEADALERRLPHDPVTGDLLWNDRAKQTIAPYVSRYLSTKDKSDFLYKQSEFQRKSDEDAEKVRHDQETEKYQRSEIAVRREGIAAANKRAAMVAERVGSRMDYSMFKDTQAQINRNAEQYKIRDYQKGFEVADRAEQALLDPARGYADVTAPAARTLSDQFKLMIDNYRSRTGGKYQEQELTRMNGLLQRLDKYVETIGEGDKILAKDVMLQTAQEMKKLALDRNADVVKTELKMGKSLRDRGTDPVPLTTYGDIESLKRYNIAKEVELDGKKYLVFGRNKEDQFEIPTAPERPRLIPFDTSE